MDTERNLLFGVVAFQNGTVDADRLAETCAAWVEKPSRSMANLFVDRGLMTDEQKTEVEKVVARELEAHGGDPQATLAATMDGRSLEAIGDAAGPDGALKAHLDLSPQAQSGHVVLGSLSPSEESRERYTLTHLHAKGGMGRVWLARDGALGRQIALKELRPDQAGNSIVCSRFLYEAKITAQLEHPGIVPVYELGEGEAPYYTMRFVRGRTLSEAIRAYHKKRAAGEVDSVGKVELLTAFVNVCHAVAYAHSRGIIHRDLKGQNVVLGGFGEVMVLDWGLAKRVGPDQQADGSGQEIAIADPAPGPAVAPALDAAPDSAVACGAGGNPDDDPTLPESHDIRSGSASSSSPMSNGSAKDRANPSSNGSASHRSGSGSGSSLGRQTNRESGAGPDGTMQGQLLGTPAYMAPEQAQGRHDLVDERTDVYGLGAILYEILTGRPPFIAPKTSEIIRKVCQELPTPPRQILASIPPGLEGVCMKALRKSSSERYTTAAELAQEVQRYLADEPVRAYAEPWTSRLLRWGRRHKTAVSAAAALLVTATVALAVSTVLVTNEKKEAESQGQQARHAVQLLTKVADISFDDQLNPLQKEFLEDALQYYEQFTSRVAHDPAVRLEHGHVYQQMGDIQRKLGRLPESRQAYLKAIEILTPLADHVSAGPEPRRVLARTRTLLADLLVRSGGDKVQAAPLYRQALEVQQALTSAAAVKIEDRLRLGQTLKSQGDLLRLNGQLADAESAYTKALAVLDQARANELNHCELRNELAMTTDARGWIFRERGDVKQAEQAYIHALKLLEDLVKEFPTVSHYRESLARASNSLALIEESTGRLTDAETHLRRELPLVERLSQDFPDRPEYRRELARTLSNLGNVLSAENRDQDAEPVLRHAIDVNTAITVAEPDDVQVRLDLAKCYSNLGELFRKNGDAKQAVVLFRQAQSISEALAKAIPDQPRYRALVATTLYNLALALETVAPAKVEETYKAALTIYENIVRDYPDNVEYGLDQAECLRNLGVVVADSGRPEQAEAIYHKVLSLLETKDANSQKAEWLRVKAQALTYLGALQRPGAEEAFRRSIKLSLDLVARRPLVITDRHNLAIAQNNLGEFLIDQNRLPEAGLTFVESVANFEKLVRDAPRSIEYLGHFGHVLAKQGDLFERTGKLSEARSALARAVEQQRHRLKLSKDQDEIRGSLGGDLITLATIDLKLGAYEEAARSALELPKAVAARSRGQACFDAARILARLITSVDGDVKRAQAERDRLIHAYLGRTVVLLREAIDTDSKLAELINTNTDIRLLESRPEFRTMMGTLVNLGK
jgi:eukaryotic-like serine/threonine-protein kinase